MVQNQSKALEVLYRCGRYICLETPLLYYLQACVIRISLIYKQKIILDYVK